MMRGLVVLAVGAAAGASWADERGDGWRPFFAVGLTRGGDVLQTTQIVDTPRIQHLYAGNLLQLGFGGLWTSRSLPLSVALSVNYHIDDNTGATGNATFSRIPFEAIAYYVTEDREWRAGLGIRYVHRPRLTGHFPENPGRKEFEYTFRDSRGVVAETGWAYGKNVWINLRAVKELYDCKTYIEDGAEQPCEFFEKINGSHVGINFLYAF
jgi:hypothetical protein